MIDNKKLTLNFSSRIGLFICTAIIGFFITSITSVIITYAWGINTPSLRISTILQNLFLFIAPTIITAIFITKLPADFLQLRKCPSIKFFILTIVILILSVPAMNFIVHCNKSIVFPESMKTIESTLKAMEETSREQIKILLGEPTIGSLVISIFIVGLLTGLGEELFFRGGLQNILCTKPSNPHKAIWITAIIFSAMHFQFYGFIPRVLLGAFFGYLAYWSGSIWLPIFAHALNNSLVVISTWLISRNTMDIDINKIGTDLSIESYILIVISAIATTIGTIILYRYSKQHGHLKALK